MADVDPDLCRYMTTISYAVQANIMLLITIDFISHDIPLHLIQHLFATLKNTLIN